MDSSFLTSDSDRRAEFWGQELAGFVLPLLLMPNELLLNRFEWIFEGFLAEICEF